MEENYFDDCIFGDYFFFVLQRFAWQHVVDMFSDNEECIICDNYVGRYPGKEDLSFA